jgi:4-hydroxybenzoate polyprenyltransferase
MTHTDIRPSFIHKLPVALQPFALLSRWDRPIGSWLLLLPCWWALVMAHGASLLFVLFAVGAVVMRGAGCTLNDILDRKMDAQVERTRGRPLPSGAVTTRQAILWLLVQLGLGFIVLLLLSPLAIGLGVTSLLLVGTYPLMKRVTWWPQLVLGLTFNWGILMAWAAADGALVESVYWLYAAGIAWTMVYDTIYAHQDKVDDALIGVKSTARLFAGHSRLILSGFAVVAMSCFAMAGWSALLGVGYYGGLLLAAAHLVWQLKTWRMDDPDDCLQKFRSNRDFAVLIILAMILGRLT